MIKKISNYFLNLLIFVFSIILLASIYVNIQTKILKSPYANFFGYSMFEVQTGSMADAINIGDWIIVKLTDNIKLDDIVTYESNGNYITHRVKEIHGNTYITKGDANGSKDDPISGDAIIGKVTKVLPRFGIIRKTLFNPLVLICVIITLFLINLTFKNNDDTRYKKKMEKIISYFKNFISKLVKSKTSFEFDESLDDTTSKSTLYDDKGDFIREDDSYKEEDVEKTAIYRIVSVDAEDVNITSSKEEDIVDESIPNIEKEEKKEEKIETKKEVSKDKKEEEIVEESKETKIENIKKENSASDYDIDDLKDDDSIKAKKAKNIIEKIVSLKHDELIELMNLFEGEDHNLVNEYTIKEKFINAFIEVRYFNEISDEDVSSISRFTSKVEKMIKSLGSKMVSEYTGSDTKYSDKISKYVNMFMLLASVENNQYKTALNKFYSSSDIDSTNIKYLTSEIVKIKKKYESIINYLFDKLESNEFKLDLSKVPSIKNTYAVRLEHTINFNKVYSNYIVDKTYNEGIVAEDKFIVLFSLLLNIIAKDMIDSNFNRKYMVYIPSSLYEKEKKFERFLNLISNSYCKSHISILVSINDFLKNVELITKFKQEGYTFSIIYDSEVKILYENYGVLYIADYIFINKSEIDISNVFAFVPEEIYSKFVFDNILDKIDYYRRD